MLKSCLSLLFVSIFLSVYAQVPALNQYIEKGKTVDEIYKKADRLIKRNKFEDINFRREMEEGEHSEEYLDDDRMKLERWRWYWRDRVGEDGKFPDLQRQWRLYQSVLQDASLEHRQATTWKHEGPVKNTGGYWGMGRATHVAFHPTQPKTFFVAAPNGGLWKTTDGGASYNSLGDDLPYQPIGIVIVDPKNPNNIYITLGEKDGWWQYSLGVYKSTDGGKVWNPTALNWKLTDNKVIYGMDINPLNPNVLIATTNAGIYKTTNGGNSWTRMRTEEFSDVKFKIGDTSIVYAAKNDYWGSCEVFKSTDGGNNWNQISSFNKQKAFLRLAVTPADPEYLAVNASIDGAKKFILSENGGNSFKEISDMPDNAVFFISAKNKKIIYSGYVNLFRSDDGGLTWNQISLWYAQNDFPEVHADHHYAAFNPSNPDDIYFCCDGGVYRYHEPTRQFTELQNGYAVTQFYKMAISTTTPPVLIGGSQDNGGYIRRANGTWGNTNGGDAMWQIIDPTNANIGYSEYWGGNAVYRTTNGFNNLIDIAPNIPGKPQGQWVTPFGLNPKNTRTFIIGYHEVFVSHDRGNNFVQISSNLTGGEDRDLRNVQFSPVDTNAIYASYNNIFYYTKDYGKKWSKSTLSSSMEITSIEAHPKDVKRLWVTRGGLEAIKVMQSKDQGLTWQNITANFVNTPALSIAYDEASNSLFVGTDMGLFYSDADAISWKYYGTGLPNTSVTDIDIHQATRRLYVSTFGRGFYSVDLPTCSPSSVTMVAKINNGNFIDTDTLRICIGESIIIKTLNDTLSGTYHITGPLSLDTTMTNTSTLNLGVMRKFNQSGVYSITYTSAKGCQRIDQMYFRVLPIPNATATSDALAFHCNRDTIRLSTSVTGDPNYNISWKTSFGTATNVPSFIITNPGSYYATIKNIATQCAIIDTVDIIRIEDPIISARIVDNICYASPSGQVWLTPSKGMKPYTYRWDDGSVDDNRIYLYGGRYAVLLKDANGCEVIDTFIVANLSSEFIVTEKITHTSSSNGMIDLSISGAVPPYKFKWSGPNNFTSNNEDINNLIPGDYDVWITDSLGCTFGKKVEIKNNVANADFNLTDLHLSPNPAKEILTIHSDKINLLQYQLSILDLNAKKLNPIILSKNANAVVLNVSTFTVGRYILQLSNENNKFEKIFTIIK